MRQCGGCDLCCRLVPVVELDKGANQRCQYQGFGCCMVYQQAPKFPMSCSLWNCRWLVDDAGKTDRPDRVHYVIDIMPDTIQVTGDGIRGMTLPVIQVWVDPAHPDAHRDPALRKYLDKKKAIALIRYSDRDGFTLWPPSLSSDGEWHEKTGGTYIRPPSAAIKELDAAYKAANVRL